MRISHLARCTVLLATLAVSAAGAPGKGGGKPKPPPPPADPAIVLNGGGSIYMMNADGSNLTLVLPNAGHSVLLQPAWSPDATQIVFTGTPGGLAAGIYIVNRDGSGLRLVTPLDPGNDSKPAWSPVPSVDGKYKIAFTATPLGNPTGTLELYVVNPDGTGLTRLTTTPLLYEYEVTWSGDARRLAMGYLIAVDLQVLDLALDGGGGIVVSAASSLIDVPGSGLRGASNIAWPDWARTQNRIVLAATTPGGNAWDLWVIDLANPAGAFPLSIGKRTANERQPTWSPDDGRIAFWYQAGGKSGLYTVNADGSGLTQIVNGGRRPDWKR